MLNLVISTRLQRSRPYCVYHSSRIYPPIMFATDDFNALAVYPPVFPLALYPVLGLNLIYSMCVGYRCVIALKQMCTANQI